MCTYIAELKLRRAWCARTTLLPLRRRRRYLVRLLSASPFLGRLPDTECTLPRGLPTFNEVGNVVVQGEGFATPFREVFLFLGTLDYIQESVS